MFSLTISQPAVFLYNFIFILFLLRRISKRVDRCLSASRKSMKTAPEVMPHVLFYWPMSSEINTCDMAMKTEPSHQYSTKFSFCAADDSSG